MKLFSWVVEVDGISAKINVHACLLDQAYGMIARKVGPAIVEEIKNQEPEIRDTSKQVFTDIFVTKRAKNDPTMAGFIAKVQAGEFKSLEDIQLAAMEIEL